MALCAVGAHQGIHTLWELGNVERTNLYDRRAVEICHLGLAQTFRCLQVELDRKASFWVDVTLRLPSILNLVYSSKSTLMSESLLSVSLLNFCSEYPCKCVDRSRPVELINSRHSQSHHSSTSNIDHLHPGQYDIERWADNNIPSTEVISGCFLSCVRVPNWVLFQGYIVADITSPKPPAVLPPPNIFVIRCF